MKLHIILFAFLVSITLSSSTIMNKNKGKSLPEYSISDTIPAGAEELFHIISNFEDYHVWNSLIPEAKGKLQMNEKLKLKILHDGKLRNFKPKVIAIDSTVGFTLRKSMLLNAVVLMHEFKIQSISSNQSVLTQTWTGKGWIAKSSWKKFTPLFEAFKTYNEDLKKYLLSKQKTQN
jgi:hypothetical protein